MQMRMQKTGRRTRGGRGPGAAAAVAAAGGDGLLVLQHDVPEEDHRTSDSSDDDQVWATDDEGEAHEGGEAGGRSTASAMARVYLRGPSKLPGPPLPLLRPVIRPQGDR
jgi:hypothetical protein